MKWNRGPSDNPKEYKKRFSQNNAFYAMVRIIGENRKLPIPETAAERLTEPRALNLGWTQKQWNSVEQKARKADVRDRKPQNNTLAAYDDSFTMTRAKREVVQKPRKLFNGERKKAEYIEDKLQRKCLAYARKLGALAQIVDNDNNPDTMYLYKRILLGWAEFKSPTGRATEGQENRIKELRKYFRDSQVARVFNRFEDFKVWLNNRIKKV